MHAWSWRKKNETITYYFYDHPPIQPSAAISTLVLNKASHIEYVSQDFIGDILMYHTKTVDTATKKVTYENTDCYQLIHDSDFWWYYFMFYNKISCDWKGDEKENQ